MVAISRSPLSITSAEELRRMRLIDRHERAGVFEGVLHGIDEEARALVNEVGIQLLELRHLSCDEDPPFAMSLRDPGVDT
jgi:hypothetical protein